jgi:hypothetical protein
MEVRDVLPRDAIPSVDDPQFVTDYDGDPDDEVVVLDWADPPRAYPVRYLHFHEIVNDVVPVDESDDSGDATATSAPAEHTDVPVAVTWCPLCGSAVVYERVVETDGETNDAETVGDHSEEGTDTTRTLTFGVSGKLADDDLVMYDRETESEWKQSLGRAISGPLAGSDLAVRPASLTTWATFQETTPAGLVLAPPGGASEAASDTDDPTEIDYDTGVYDDYLTGEGFGLSAHRGTGQSREWDREDLHPKTVVLGLTDDSETGARDAAVGGAGADTSAVGVPRPVVDSAGGVVTLAVGDTDAVVFATPDGLHAYRDPGYDFDSVADSGGDDAHPTRFRADDTVWHGATGTSEDGRRLDRLPARRLFAFTWQDDHGPDAFYGLG